MCIRDRLQWLAAGTKVRSRYKRKFELSEFDITRFDCILLQEKSGVKHPIAFASRKLLLREVHYSTIEKEYLEIDWAIKKVTELSIQKIIYSENRS